MSSTHDPAEGHSGGDAVRGSWSSGWRGALAFLTPIGGAAHPSPLCLPWFPVVGALVGGAVGGVWWGASELWPPLVAAALAVSADLALTGVLHIDGLADTADGLLPPVPPEERAAIMAAPDVGAFGATAIVVVLLLRTAALASTDVEVPVVVALWAASRAVMAGVLVSMPYAGGGLAARFRGGSGVPTAWVGLAAAAVIIAGGARWDALAGLVAGLLLAAGLLELSRRRLGGFTGDVLGALGVLIETVGLLGLAAA